MLHLFNSHHKNEPMIDILASPDNVEASELNGTSRRCANQLPLYFMKLLS